MSAPVDISYLGPSGTFTEQAVLALVEGQASSTRPANTVKAALDDVRTGRARTAVVPFENSVEGSVSATLDGLIHGEALVIVREVEVAVRFAVVAKPGTQLSDIRRIATHPHAAAQTRQWIARHIPLAEILPEGSTAGAAELVATGQYDAAIASELAGRRHSLAVVADDIADRAGAVTRFVQVRPPGIPEPMTGADNTTLVAFLKQNRPGALLEVLEQFAARGVDLRRLESRPTGQGLGEYCFAIDADAHIDEPRMAEALAGLHRTSSQVRFLGSYPRADGRVTSVPGGAEEKSYRAAQDWVQSLRGTQPTNSAD